MITLIPAEERAKLGPKAEAIINGMANWGRGLVSKGILSADEFDEFKIMGGTAKGLQVMMKIRSSYEGAFQLSLYPSKVCLLMKNCNKWLETQSTTQTRHTVPRLKSCLINATTNKTFSPECWPLLDRGLFLGILVSVARRR
jgi:hypothetical protein